MTNSDIKTKVAEIIDSKSKAEHLIDLLAALEEDSISSKLRGIHALNKSWTHVIRRGDLKVDKNEESDKYKTWIREVFQQSWNKLTELISEDEVENNGNILIYYKPQSSLSFVLFYVWHNIFIE